MSEKTIPDYPFDETDDQISQLRHSLVMMNNDRPRQGLETTPAYERSTRNARAALDTVVDNPKLSEDEKRSVRLAHEAASQDTTDDGTEYLGKIPRIGARLDRDDYFEGKGSSPGVLHDKLADALEDQAKSTPDSAAWHRKRAATDKAFRRMKDAGVVHDGDDAIAELSADFDEVSRENTKGLALALCKRRIGESAARSNAPGCRSSLFAADRTQEDLAEYQDALHDLAEVDPYEDKIEMGYRAARCDRLESKLSSAALSDEARHDLHQAKLYAETGETTEAMDAVAHAAGSSLGDQSEGLYPLDPGSGSQAHTDMATGLIDGYYGSPYAKAPNTGAGIEAYTQDVVGKLPAMTSQQRTGVAAVLGSTLHGEESDRADAPGVDDLASELHHVHPVIDHDLRTDFVDGQTPRQWGLSEPGYGNVLANKSHLYRSLDNGKTWQRRPKSGSDGVRWEKTGYPPSAVKTIAPHDAAQILGGKCIACGPECAKHM